MLMEELHYIAIFFIMMAVSIPIACAIWFIRGGIISKILATPVLIMAIFSYGYLGWSKLQDWQRGYNEQEKILENVELFKQGGQKEVKLEKVIPFSWTSMCKLTPYTSYDYEYPPSDKGIEYFIALGGQALSYSNESDGSTKYIFRMNDGEIKEMESIFIDVELISGKGSALCYTPDDYITK